MRRMLAAAATAVSLAAGCAPPESFPARLVIEPVPGGGIQPQLAAGPDGIVHAVYFTGDPARGDIDYATRSTDGIWSPAVRVNTLAASAVALASVRGAQIAIGRNGRVHVVWNGSRHLSAPATGLPVFYARLDPDTRRFEPQRNLITWADGVDGGGSVASDQKGRVAVVWHANPSHGDDAARAVYVARSSDDGATFGHEVRASDDSGACSCCGLRALFDRSSTLHVIFRAADNNLDRDMMALRLPPGVETFVSRRMDPWKIDTCPLSTSSIAIGPDVVRAAWETNGRIRLADLRPASEPPMVHTVGGNGRRKHPVLAFNAAGESIVTWLEDSGWARGGRVAFQLYDRNGIPVETGTAGEVSAWGLAAVAPLSDGRFLLVR